MNGHAPLRIMVASSVYGFETELDQLCGVLGYLSTQFADSDRVRQIVEEMNAL